MDLRFALLLSTTLAVTGCTVVPQPLDQASLAKIADDNMSRVVAAQEPVSGSIDVYEAIARALKYNLDQRVELMQEAVNLQELTLANYQGLPNLVANSGYTGRNNVLASSSVSVLTGQESLEPSTSSDKNILDADIALSWNVLDFGLSYVRARQAADKVLMQREARRKALNRIVEDVRTAYWRAIASERLLSRLNSLESKTRKAIADSRALATERQTSTLTMIPVNDPPVATDDTGTTPEDTTLNGNVLSNDTDIDGGALSVTQFVVGGTTYTAGQTAALPGIGALTIRANGSYTFIPAPNYNGPGPVATYTVSDGAGGTDTAVLTITVTPVNDPPEPDADIPNQTSVDATSVSPVDVSGYFFDVDGDVLTYTASGLPSGLSIDAVTGVIRGTLPNDASQDSPYIVVVTATDPSGATARQIFTWTVTNPLPIAANDTASVPEDTVLTGTVIANDNDPDGDAIRVTQFAIGGTAYTAGQTATLAGIGALNINADGSYTFTPALNFNGPVPVATYTLSDSDGGTGTAMLAITVTPVNDPPDIVDDHASGTEDTTISGNVLENDSDPDDDPLVVTGFSVDGDPTIYLPGETATISGVGTISIESDGDFTFIPAPNYDGPVPDIFYTASDGNGGTGQATLVITITPVDDFVPTHDDNESDLPIGPDYEFEPIEAEGAVVEAVNNIQSLDTPMRLVLNTFLGALLPLSLINPAKLTRRFMSKQSSTRVFFICKLSRRPKAAATLLH